MAARDKYEEAKFFYNKMVNEVCGEPEIGYYFSAFLNAANSIPDYALEEANEHFHLSIPENSKSIRKKFESVVKGANIAELTAFV